MIRKVSLVLTACAVSLLVTATVRADDAADAKVIVEKAIKAVGGAEKLDKTKAFTSKIKGKVFAMGLELDLKSTTTFQGPDRMRIESDIEVMGHQFKQLQVVDKDNGWLVMHDKNMEMTKDMLDAAKERFYATSVSRLTPLLAGKEFKLSPIGESKVEGIDVVGIRVESKGHADISLFFDKKTGLLAKTDRREKDPQGGTEYNTESFLSDYKETDGLKMAQKLKVLHDGKEYVVADVLEYRTETELSDTLFAKP